MSQVLEVILRTRCNFFHFMRKILLTVLVIILLRQQTIFSCATESMTLFTSESFVTTYGFQILMILTDYHQI